MINLTYAIKLNHYCIAQKKKKKNSIVSLRTLETENVVTSPLTGQACLPVFEYLSSIDSFGRSEDINLTALNFATKKQEDTFERLKFKARKTGLLSKYFARR